MPPLDFKLKQPGATLMMALSTVFPAAASANAGRVDFVSGDVKAIATDGRIRTLAKGATFDSGETVETGEGRAQLRFTDGGLISLQPRSQFRVDNYNFSGSTDGSEKGFFSLLKGGLRTITGQVGRANRDNYKVTTSVATIGIRGTEYSIQYGNSITVTTGEGIIEICNAAGCLILNSGETAYVPDVNTLPAMTDKKADVPPPPPENETLYNASRTNEAPTNLNLIPTPASVINTLSGSYSFSLVSASAPTYTTSNPGTVSSGSLTANFTSNLVSFNLGLTGGGATSITGSGAAISGSGFSGSGISINGSGGTGSFSGIFMGNGATQAQMTYKVFEATFGTVSGSATFGR